MIRYIFFTLLGFFGPALIMLFFRLLWYRMRHQWLIYKQEPEIIDVTPKKPSHMPSKLFIVLWITVSLVCTAFLLWQLDDSPAKEQTYIPAHIDAEGKFVPAQILDAKPQGQ